jgi:hypothetical protein
MPIFSLLALIPLSSTDPNLFINDSSFVELHLPVDDCLYAESYLQEMVPFLATY